MSIKIIGLILTVTCLLSGCSAGKEHPGSEQWTTYEIILESDKDFQNGYTDVEVWAIFSNGKNDSIKRPAFWDGGNTWKLRFAPPDTGSIWRWKTYSEPADKGLSGKTGSIRSLTYTGNNMLIKHGLLKMSPGKRNVVHYNRSHQSENWLDFQWAQTGHDSKHLYHKVERMYENKPVKGALNGEPTYEGMGGGRNRQIGRAWGGRDPRDSPAARSIIEAVRSLPEGQKLDIITIGAVTNVASAIIIAPEIISKIRCYTLGASYKPETGVWNKNEFNVRNDLNAFDYLLDREGLDLTIMPLEAAFPLQFDRDETYKKLNDKTGIQLILKERWIVHNPESKTRVMWDLALVEAYLNPEKATAIKALGPPENRQRERLKYTLRSSMKNLPGTSGKI